jgi:hypothetical protein
MKSGARRKIEQGPTGMQLKKRNSDIKAWGGGICWYFYVNMGETTEGPKFDVTIGWIA